MTLSMPSLDLPGILLLCGIVFVMGAAVGSYLTARAGESRRRAGRG